MIELNPNLPTEKSRIKEMIDYYTSRLDSTEAFNSIAWRIKECERLIGFPDGSDYDKKTCEELLYRYNGLKKTIEREIEALRTQLENIDANNKEMKAKARRKKKTDEEEEIDL